MFAWRCVGVVPVVSVWQIACRVQRLYVVHLHRLLSASRLSTEARRILHAFADDTQLYLHGASCCPAGTMHHRRRPLDVCQPSQAEHGDKTELLWVGSRQSFPARLLSSSSTTRFRLRGGGRVQKLVVPIPLPSTLPSPLPSPPLRSRVPSPRSRSLPSPSLPFSLPSPPFPSP